MCCLFMNCWLEIHVLLPKFFPVMIRGLNHAKGPSTGFMVASGGVLPEENGDDDPGVCLGDGQTEAYLKDMDTTGLASVWAMARRRPI